MRIFEDTRGWQFTVRPGLGRDTYSVFYRKPNKGWHSVAVIPWRGTKAESEDDLNAYAEKHKMKLIKEDKNE